MKSEINEALQNLQRSARTIGFIITEVESQRHETETKILDIRVLPHEIESMKRSLKKYGYKITKENENRN